MKNLFFNLLILPMFLFASGSIQAIPSPGSTETSQLAIACETHPSAQANSGPDTLVLKRKIRYGDKKLKNVRELQAVLETANDTETMSLFKKFKTTNALASVFLLLGGLLGIVLLFVSRGKLKKTIRRFNDIKMARAQPAVSLHDEPATNPEPSKRH